MFHLDVQDARSEAMEETNRHSRTTQGSHPVSPKKPSTVMLHSNDRALSLEDNMQVQCLPVFGSDGPKWTYRKLPKVTEFRISVDYHFGAEGRRR